VCAFSVGEIYRAIHFLLLDPSAHLFLSQCTGGSIVCFLLRDIPKARFIDGLFTAVARQSERSGHPPRGLRRRYRCCSNRFGPFALACTGIRERSSDVILVTNSDSPSRSPFLLHSASSLVFIFFFFFFFFGRRRCCFVVSPRCLSIFMLICFRQILPRIKFRDSLLLHNIAKGKIATSFPRIYDE